MRFISCKNDLGVVLKMIKKKKFTIVKISPKKFTKKQEK